MYFKAFVDTSGDQITLYLGWAKTHLLEKLLHPLKDDTKFILELTERIQAGLNLLIFMTLRERALLRQGTILSEPIITDSQYFT